MLGSQIKYNRVRIYEFLMDSKNFQEFKIIILYLAPMRNTATRPAPANTLPRQPQAAEQNQQPNQNNADQQPTAQKKQKKKRTFALKPQNFQSAKGLKKLYELTNQIKWQDPMPTQSAMNLVVITLKTWQRQMMPKYSYGYFFQRCQALGSNKLVAPFLHKVRRIHKGMDRWDQAIQENNNPNKQKPTAQKPTNNAVDNDGIDLGNPNIDNYQNYDDDIQELQKFKQRAELAKKLANTSITPNPTKQNKTDKQLIDQMMDEDLRMFEEMSRRKNTTNGNNKEGEVEQDDEVNDGVDLGGDSGVGFEDDGYYDD